MHVDMEVMMWLMEVGIYGPGTQSIHLKWHRDANVMYQLTVTVHVHDVVTDWSYFLAGYM